MARDDEVIADAVVKVGADTSGMRKDVEKGAKKELAGLKFEVPVTVDKRAAQAGLNHIAGMRANYIKDQFNRVRNFNEQVQQAEGRAFQERTRMAEKAAAEQTRIAEKAARQQERIIRESAARRNKTLFTSPQLIDYGGKGIKPMNLLYGVVTAMTPALFAMGASAVQASTSIAALGSAGVGAALGLSGVLVAFQGIGDALSLRKTVLAQGTTDAANAAQKAVRSADDLAQAKRTLADAQRDEAKAAADVHKARREAVRDLEDLKQAVIDLDNQYRNDTLSVAEAKQNLQATDRNFFATALDRARARQDLRDAQTRLSDTALERKQKKTDLRESVRKGVEGSDKVKDAKERARDARDATLNAQASLRGSSATAGGLGKVTSAAALLEAKIKELSPAAQEMYYWFDKNEGLFKRLQREISQKTLPGFNTFLKAITQPVKGKTTLQLAADYAGDLGAIIGKYAGKIGVFTKSALFRDSMARMQKINAKAFDNLGKALITLADPITRILDKAAPGFESLSKVILTLSQRFADWIKVLDESGGLADWFKDSRTELGKWFDIVKNIGTLLRNIFTASLPAGGSLVTSFRDFTKSIADWSSSATGQKQLKDFFTTIKELPYAKIADFFKNATTFFIGFRALRFLATLNPFFTAFAAFAASNPQLAADAISVVADKIAWAMEQIVKHPQAATALLAIIAAAKIGKAVGFDIKIPVMDKLRNALTSKFKVLDKFVGGGAQTATMNVQAGVVNVYGKAIGGGPGGVIPTAPGGKPLKGGSKILAGVEAVGVSNVVTAAVLFGATTGWQEFQRGLGKDKRGFVSYADIFKDDFSFDTVWNAFIDNSAITMFTMLGRKWAPALKRFFSMDLPNLLSGKTNGWAGVGQYLLEQLSMYGGDGILGGIIDGITGGAYTDFKNKISGWVDGVVDWFKKCFGIASPSTIFAEIGGDLISGLWYGFVNGWNELKEAVPTWIGENITTPLTHIFTTAGHLAAAGFASGFATLTEKLAGPAQRVLSWVDTNFVGKINSLLKSLGAPTIPTLTGKSTQDVGKNIGKTIGDIAKKARGTEGAPHADGGTVAGFSPHPKADNIPAMLTAQEFVQPVAAVKHYGTDFMEAIRTRQFPRFAEGGLAGAVGKKFGNNLFARIAAATITRAGGSVANAAARISRGFGAGPSTPGGISGIIGAGGASGQALVDFGHWLQARGFSVAEHPQFGGVHGGHVPNSWHYRGGAIDVNKGAGTSKREQAYLAAIIGEAHRRGLRSIFMAPGHYDHAHFDIGKAEGGLVRKYDTGGTLPPGYSTVYNGTGSNETVRTKQQEQALSGPVRLDPRDVALLAGAVARTGTPAVTMDGRRVAEVTNRYNYMPSGV